MLGMYGTMQLVRTVKRSADFNAGLPRSERFYLRGQPESLYGAILSQLHRRDTLLVEGADRLLEHAAEAVSSAEARAVCHRLPGTSVECAAVSAGMALQQQGGMRRQATPRPVVLTLLRDFPAMAGVLQLVQEHDLSVLLVVQGAPETRAGAQRRLLGTKVPVMPVDAADAVALCRVLQECLLRARNGWGGAVIHALRLPDAGDAIALLEAHLRKRRLL